MQDRGVARTLQNAFRPPLSQYSLNDSAQSLQRIASESSYAPQTLAAIDLGSNSFHMVVAEPDANGNLQFIDRVKEMVRLNAGLDESGNLDEASQKRALACLDRFSQRLRGIPVAQVRAVGTNTFRAAHNAELFLRRAEEALGHHISIISGHEEARLVYLGAAFSLESSGKRRLVIDIGGGSTELIIGQGYDALSMNSLYMGCVSYSRRFFANGKITLKRLRRARAAVMQELEPILLSYRRLGWEEVVGTSGTIRAVDTLSRSLGLEQDWLSPESFARVESYLLGAGHFDRLELISDRRKPVFVGGFCIISAIFEALEIQRLDCASGALREGVLFDLNGRLRDRDSRDLGVEALARRFLIDHDQSERVKTMTLTLMEQVRSDWGLDQVIHRKMLGWASRLHEIGIAIAFNQNHKHGSYIVENSDIDGFSRQQQRVLGLLVRSHRQKFPLELFDVLPEGSRKRAIRMAVLLRLSVALNRGRLDEEMPEVRVESRDEGLWVQISPEWCDAHPLTMLDLELEQSYLEQAGFSLEISCDL